MTTLHLMVGLPCSGKTTFARQLREQTDALLLSPDAWQTQLLGNTYAKDSIGDREFYDTFHTNIEKIMWEVAKQVLPLGVDVILDFGFWSREERDTFRHRAKALGVGFQIHYMDTPKEVLFARLEQRNKQADTDTMLFTPQHLQEWILLFEAPTADELEQ